MKEVVKWHIYIYIQKKKFDEDGKIVDGIASIRESVYVKSKKYHSNQKTIEKLDRLLYISDDRKTENGFKTSKEYLNLLPINKCNAESVKGKILTDIITTIIYNNEKENNR